MTLGLEWKLALRNLFRNRRRTFSTAFALIVAYIGISLLAGHVFKSEKSVNSLTVYLQHMGHISIYKNGGVDNFETHPEQYQITGDEIKQIEDMLVPLEGDIAKTAQFISVPSLLSTGNRTIPIIFQGVEPSLDDFVRDHPFPRKWTAELLQEYSEQTLAQAVKSTPDAISISIGVGELLGRFKPLGDYKVEEKELLIAGRTLEGDLNAVNATLSLKHTTGMPYIEDVSVIGPLSLVQELLQTKGASHFVLFLRNPDRLNYVLSSVRKEIEKRGLPLEALPFNDERIGRFYVGTMSFLLVMVSFFACLILGASTLIIVNSLTISVLERSKEMGTLRSLGFTPQRVRSLFVKESVWLGVFSCAIGYLGTEIMSRFVNSLGLHFLAVGVSHPLKVELIIEPWFHLSLMLSLIGIASLSAYWVVTRKTKEKISTLLMDSGASV